MMLITAQNESFIPYILNCRIGFRILLVKTVVKHCEQIVEMHHQYVGKLHPAVVIISIGGRSWVDNGDDVPESASCIFK